MRSSVSCAFVSVGLVREPKRAWDLEAQGLRGEDQHQIPANQLEKVRILRERRFGFVARPRGASFYTSERSTLLT